MSSIALRSLTRGISPFFVPMSRIAAFRRPTSLGRGNRMFSMTPQRLSDMFCFQCEQTQDGTGCTTLGVCGKTPETAALQDLLVYNVKGLSYVAKRLRDMGIIDYDADRWTRDAIFSTLTNVNFSPERMHDYIQECVSIRDRLQSTYINTCAENKKTPDPLDNEFVRYSPAHKTLMTLIEEGKKVGIESRRDGTQEDILGVQELITYGIKGMAAYAAHADALGPVNDDVAGFIYSALDYLTRPKQDLNELLQCALECGKVNLKVMEILNELHVEHFGHPVPTKIRTTPIKGKCLLVSGHDLHDLEEILKATEGKGINVYTHGELLPAHGYPGLKKYEHLVGNYGGAWQLQKIEFSDFPGPIVITTNCIIEPRQAYKDRIYTINAVGYPGVTHLADKNYDVIVKQALELPGFDEDDDPEYTMTGFGHNAVLDVADTVVGAVKDGRIKRFFLIGGCDGYEGERSYYKKLALGLPKDTVVLTLACGKYRFNKLMDEFGTVEGTSIPRLLDVGQCNDAYSAIRIAGALADAFKTDVNSLPLSIVLSWFEQKAVAILLSLLYLGIKNIRIGPNLPAFVTPTVLDVLVKQYNLTPIGNYKEDMKAMLANV